MERTGLFYVTFLVATLLFSAGCMTSPSDSALPSKGTSTPPQSAPSATVVAVQPTTMIVSGGVLFDKTFSLKSGYQTTYGKYAFQDYNYLYLYPGDRFQISVTASKPVNVLVIGKTDELKFDSVEPQWNTVLKKDQWDYSPLVPAFSKSNVLDENLIFTVKDKSTYFLIIDPRFASDQAGWKGSKHDDIQGTVKVIKI